MLLPELIDMTYPCCLTNIGQFLLTEPLLEYGIVEGKSVAFGSYQTDDGLIGCVAYKTPINKEIFGLNSEVCESGKYYSFNSIKNIANGTANFKWPSESENSGLKVDIDLGSEVTVSMVPMHVVETLLNTHKNSVRNTEQIIKIKNKVAIDDTLPPNAKVIGTITVKATVDTYERVAVRHTIKWTIKAIQYSSNRIALLGSPDPGWYKFKPLMDIEIPSRTSKEISTDVLQLFTNGNFNIYVPRISLPPYAPTNQLILYGFKEAITNFRINIIKILISKLLSTKICVALVPYEYNFLYRNTNAYSGWVIISRFKNGKLKAQLIKPLNSSRSINSCLETIPITDDMVEVLRRPSTPIFIQDQSTTREKLIEELTMACTLNKI